MFKNTLLPFRKPLARGRFLAGALCAAWLAGVAGCAADPVPVNDDILKATRFLRYTLRAEPSGYHQLAYRSNYLGFKTAFRAGTRVDFLLYSNIRVDLDMNGITCRMYPRDLRFPTDPDGIKRFVEKYFAATKEELNLESLEPSIRNQVDSGVAAIGMTKEQVFLALGYPSHINETFAVADELTREQIFEANTWVYRFNEILWIPTWYVYKFDKDGKLVQRIP